jgi:hypothetical protein
MQKEIFITNAKQKWKNAAKMSQNNVMHKMIAMTLFKG